LPPGSLTLIIVGGVLNDNRENPSPSDAATVDGARYDIISILGKRVTLVTSRSVDVIGAGVGLHVRSWHF
jgi:hypothetical protein